MGWRQAALFVSLAAGVTGCGSRQFSVSGTITIASSLQPHAPKQNAVMFIVAKNMGGVPLAVKRIVNPQFPVNYTLDSDDLVVPGTRPKDALRVEVEMNTHGNVGSPMRGDLAGFYSEPVYTGARGVHIVIDRQL